MTAEVTIRPMCIEEVDGVAELVSRVFRAAVAPHYRKRGIDEFCAYANAKALQQRQRSDHFVLVAIRNEALVAMIEIRENRHVSLFFVEPAVQGQGIGRRLLNEAIIRCRETNPTLEKITVNASPNSVDAYSRHGFGATGPSQTKNGMTFTPMALTL